MKHIIQKDDAQKGFTLLYTLLVVSLILAVSSSIIGIITKELALSGYARDSQIAYYAAESAAECTLFNMLNGMPFDGTETLYCDGYTTTENVDKDDPFTIEFSGTTACAEVRVYDVGLNVYIDARGYNTCASSLRRVERGVRVVF